MSEPRSCGPEPGRRRRRRGGGDEHEPKQLRLYAGGGEAGDGDAPATTADDGCRVSAANTLGEFFERYYLPVILKSRQAQARNVKQYRESLRYWATLTENPPVRDIDEFDCAEFVARLSALPGRNGPLSPNTVRKHANQVQMVLEAAGPRDRKHRQAKSLLDEVPWIERPRARGNPVEDSFTLDELEIILPHCDAAIAPRLHGILPKAWWRSCFIFDYNVGLRPQTLFTMEYSWIVGSWLQVPAQAGSIKRGDGKKFYLNDAALEAIDVIRTRRRVVFDFPGGYPAAQGWLNENRRRILAAAGLPPARRFGFKGFRKLLATTLAIDQKNPKAAQLALGHASPQTTDVYTNPQHLRGAMAQLPQPKERTRSDLRQLELF